MSAIENLRIIVQIKPITSFSLPSIMSSAPIFVIGTFLDLMYAKAKFKFSTFWILILGVLLNLPNFSSPMISNNSINFTPSAMSTTRSLIFNFCICNLLLTHFVNVFF
eukprot:NODE_74_length_23402_cov_1.166974.p11 type:complete len:108 gc:universal NODE_74_length_23402_cov_1.166974:5646-5969(+)